MKKNIHIRGLLCLLTAGVAASCTGGRFVSADADLEEIYGGRSYYEVVEEFGEPDGKIPDGMGGTKVAYDSVSLGGTKAADLYHRYRVRNRNTKSEGAPTGGITFTFDGKMRCYAVDSDFQRERVREEKPHRAAAKGDIRRPMKISPKVPRTLEYPMIDSKSPFAETVTVEKVEVRKDCTKVYFLYKCRTPRRVPVTGDGLFIMPDTYIEDCANGHRFGMTDHAGITLYPERTRFARNQGGYDILSYSLTFEPIEPGTEYINVVEPGHSGYNFYGVDVRTPLTSKEELKESVR